MNRRRVALAVLAAVALLGLCVSPSGAAAPSAAFDTGPAKAALHRLLGGAAGRFELRAVRADGTGDSFTVSGRHGRIVLAATSDATLLTAANWYLKNDAHAGITWDGSSTNRLPRRLPTPRATQTVRTPFANRFAGNDVMQAYTGPYWSWSDWEHEIDVLAAAGINEVLVYPGQAEVYERTFTRFGYSAAEMRNWIVQPSRQPWWLLQNMAGYNEPISQSLLDRQAALARRIADRLRQLGMTPVFPGYFGTVPPGFADRNGGAHTVAQGQWGGGFDRPDWLDPRDPAYAKVAARFYAEQDKLFGATTMYKMDPLHEGGIDGGIPLDTAGHDIQTALETAHPGATWAILGWQGNPNPDLLSGVDKSHMLVVDGESDVNSGTNREKDWSGTPYAYGTIWNFGGRTVMGANSAAWVRDFPAWAGKSGSALTGIAMMPEANDNNPYAFSLFTDLAWHPDGIDLAAWTRQFADWRYGGTDPHAEAAWQTLQRTAYSTPSDGQDRQPQSLFAAEPSLTADWGSSRYDVTAFAAALPQLLAVSPRLRHNSAYSYDVVDVARQVLANTGYSLLPAIKAAYDSGDRAAFDRLSGHWLSLMRLDNQLLGSDSHFLLGKWLGQIGPWAANPAELARLQFDARGLVTEWADVPGAEAGLHDYADRDWQGLMAFYTDRWQRYFGTLDTALRTGKAPTPVNWAQVDDTWAHQSTHYPTTPTGDPHRLAAQVYSAATADTDLGSVTLQANPQTIRANATSTVTATVTNNNPYQTATGIDVQLTAPAGITVTPGHVSGSSAGPGASVTETFTLTGTDGLASKTALDELTVIGHATYRIAGQNADAIGDTALWLGDPPTGDYHTASFNNAVFGQKGDDFAIYGGGADMWLGTNEYATIYRQKAFASGDTATTIVTDQANTEPYARAGIVARNDLTGQNSSPGYVDLAVTPGHGCMLSYDSDGNGQLDAFDASTTAFTTPVHLKLSRSGDTFTGSCSTDGTTWQQVGTVTVPGTATTQDVGLLMSAVNGGSGATGVDRFTGFAVSD